MLPIFFSKPALVVGTPVSRANFCLAEVTPSVFFRRRRFRICWLLHCDC